VEGYEGVAALKKGGGSAPQRRLYSRGAPLKPALVARGGGEVWLLWGRDARVNPPSIFTVG